MRRRLRCRLQAVRALPARASEMTGRSARPSERSAIGGGPWLRLCGLGASATGVVVVASGELGIAHRALVVVALPLLVALVLGAWFAHRQALVLASVALVLFLAAVATWWLRPLHLTLAAAALTATLLTTARLHRGARPQPVAWRDYVALTKPRIMSLLLLTGAAGMFVGANGVPEPGLLVATVVGLALACGGASALNHVIDRDIDRSMGRTSERPVAGRRVSPELGLEFGLALSALSFVLLGSVVNVLAAVLALVGNLFYVLVYTRWLKRSTPQNIVIGGAAGAVPPLVGWAAATGNLALPALYLFLIVFFWTPPHFWALALLIKRDYEAARIPMLPVVRGERETTRQILLYTLALVAVTFVPVLTGTFGPVYLAAATVLGGQFLRLAWSLRRELTPRRASILFHYSLAYLALLFVAMAVEPLVL
jgi:heme o synthase